MRHSKLKKTTKARTAWKSHQRLSLCMIVKNEERHLPGCLASVRGLVDEIVVVDTGSSDNTIEIAKSFGGKVFHFQWIDDFAAARNESLRHATGDWILYLDADERIAEADHWKVRKAIESGAPYGAYLLRIVGQVGVGEGSQTKVHTYPRLFRNSPKIRFDGAVHEQIASSLLQAGMTAGYCDAVIQHLGYAVSPEEEKAKYERNLRLLEAQARCNPDHFFTRFNLGRTYVGLKRYDEGLAELQRAVELQDTDREAHLKANAYLVIGQLLLNHKKDLDGAIAAGRKALSYNASLPAARVLIGQVHFTRGNFQEAVGEFSEAIKLFERGHRARELCDETLDHQDDLYWRLGLSQSRSGQHREAIHSFEQAIRLNPQRPDYHLELGHSLGSAGELNRALDAFQRCADLCTDDKKAAMAHYNRGVAYMKLDRPAEAEVAFRAALELHPGMVGATRALVTLWTKQGRHDEALTLIPSLPKEVADRPEVLDLRLTLHSALGDWLAVAEVGQKLTALGVRSARVLTFLGQAREHLGDLEAAVKRYEEAVTLDPEYAPAWAAIGQYCRRIGNLAMAKEALAMAVTLGLRSAETLSTLGIICLERGERAEAERYFKRALEIDPQNELARANASELVAAGR